MKNGPECDTEPPLIKDKFGHPTKRNLILNKNLKRGITIYKVPKMYLKNMMSSKTCIEIDVRTEERSSG